MTETFVTSDLHLGHVNIIEYCNRPFADVAEMNEALVERWNARVGRNDETYILGDLAMGSIMDSLSYVPRMNGRKYLVSGNHDRCWSGWRGGPRIEPYVYAGVIVVEEQRILALDDTHSALMCHFPYAGDSQDQDRFDAHRPVDTGGWLLHGHVHTAWEQNGRQINVGVDVRDFEPMHVEEVRMLMDAT